MKNTIFLKFCLFLLVTAIAAISLFSCNRDNESPEKAIAKYHSFSLSNSSDHDVYGYYKFGESGGTVGILGPGSSKTMGFMPFSHSQKAILTFKCESEDAAPCAIGEVDVSKHYPAGEFNSITTVFTYKPDNTVELSFSISEIDSSPGETKDIVIGNISK